MDRDLQGFVREALARGAPRPAIREKLLAAGWHEDEVRNALASFLDADFPVPVPRRRPYLSAREAFLYLVTFAALYVSAIEYGTLLFQFINRWLPDAADPEWRVRGATSTIRRATASLIIAFPVFMILSWRLDRAVALDRERRASRVRKWLTYLTLFSAAGVIIGDLITLVYNLLEGELTLRFVLKCVVVLAIAGAAFGCYLWDLRQEEKDDA